MTFTAGALINIRPDPFERTLSTRGQSLNESGGGYLNDFMGREFWPFVEVQEKVAELAETAVQFPQSPASFNLDAVKRKIDEKIKQHEGE
jgi:arylsulfatase